MINFRISLILMVFFSPISAKAASYNESQLSVWVNEAIIATYSYNYQNFMQRQKEIAKYFTAEGWTAYSKAVTDSKLPESIQKNSYSVSAVATYPPQIKTLAPDQWEAKMPILVIFKNPQYQQKQSLEITIRFNGKSTDEGVRGLAITGLQSNVTEPPCQCQASKE